MKNFAPHRLLFLKIQEWLRLQKLEHDLRASRRFQKHCEKLNCPNLAAMEQGYQHTLLHQIGEARQRTFSSPTPQILKLQTELKP